MFAFSIMTLAIIIARGISQQNKNTDESNKVFCCLSFVILTFMMGLRSRYTAGADTNLSYIPLFERICTMSMGDVIRLYSGGNDITFKISTKIFTYICKDYHIYLLTISIFVVGSVIRFIYRNSNDCFFSIILYCALGYYGISFQLLRHAIALSILLFAYDYLIERKPIKFFGFVIIASLFHISALVFAIAYPLWSVKFKKKQWVVLAIILITSYFFRNQLANVLSILLSDRGRYSAYFSENYSRQLNLTGFLVQLTVLLVSVIFIGKDEKDNLLNGLLNMSILSVAFMSLVLVIGEFHRISMFFGVYNLLLLPVSFNIYSKKSQGRSILLLRFFILFVFIGYFLAFQIDNASLSNFSFFWSK